MKAAVYHGARDIRVQDVPEPAVREADDILVRVAYCGICGTDLHEYTAGPIVTPVKPHPLTGVTLPQVLGHEFAGTVAEAGAAVGDVTEGDRVAIMPAIVCGRCAQCRRGMGQLCAKFACTGLSAETGGLAGLAVVKEYQVAKLPDDLSDAAGALIEPAAVAAYGVDRGAVRGGDIALVTGAGPVGALSALYAAALGAGLVVIAEPNPNRAGLARALDVGPVLDPASPAFDDELAELTRGAGVDIAIECSGTTPGLGTCIAQARPGGRVVQTGLHTRPATLDAMALAAKDLSLLGSWCYRLTDWPRIIRLVSAGRYDVEKVLTKTIALDDVVAAGFDALIDPLGSDLKILVRPS